VVVAEIAPAHAAVVPFDDCTIAVDVSSTVPLRWGSGDRRRFRAEGQRVWIGRGVVICWIGPGEACEGVRTRLFVRLAPRAPAAAGQEAQAHALLGWMGFSERYGPGSFIVLAVERARELLREAARRTRGFTPRPDVIERLLPQALGRALAHELGHFLLASRAHSRTGIMREALHPDDLAGPASAERLSLTRAQMELLDRRCEASRLRMARVAN
jgi:hypothetical protein